MREHIVVRRSLVAAGLLTVAVALSAACGSSSNEPNETSAPSSTGRVRSYVGSVEGTPAFVGVVVDGSRALAYVCDGVPAEPEGNPPALQAWFNAPSDGETLDVQAPGGRLQLRLTATEMSGTLTLPDARVLQVAGQATAGDAGLYRAESTGPDGRALAGWVLAADGQQRGGVGVESGGTSKLSGVRPLNLSQPTFTPQGLATARIAKVGITPIPIP